MVQSEDHLFMAITLVVMFVILIMANDLVKAVLIIGLITNFLIISSQLNLLNDRVKAPHNKQGAVVASPRPSTLVSATVEGMVAAPPEKPAPAAPHREKPAPHREKPAPTTTPVHRTTEPAMVQVHDGDELLAYQARARNDPERVWTGVYQRKKDVAPYLEEELEAEENSHWWGRHEY